MKVLSLVTSILALASGLAVTPVARAQSTDSSGDRKVVRKVNPTYPALARTLNLSGSVRLEVTVTGSGAVKSIQVLGGSPVLADAAESAVRDWKWEKSDHDTTERVEVRFNP